MDPITKTSVVRTVIEIVGAAAWPMILWLIGRFKVYRTIQTKKAKEIADEAAMAAAKAKENEMRLNLLWSGLMNRAKVVAVDRGLAKLNQEPPSMNAYVRVTEAGRELFSDLSDVLGQLYLRLSAEWGRPLKFEELAEEINRHHGSHIIDNICMRVSPPLSQYECLVLASTVAVEAAFQMSLEQIKATMPNVLH